MTAIPQSLIDELSYGRLVPFVGSGVSLSVKSDFFPTWQQLLNQMARQLEQEGKDEEAIVIRHFCKKKRPYDAAAEALSELGKAGFFHVLRETFKRARPKDAELALPQAIWKLRPAIVVTTNYDDVLGWANPQAERILNDQPAELAELYRTSTPDQPRVWHVHGHISRADSLILAPAQYDAFYRDIPQTRAQYEAALLQLKNLLVNYSLLFVGFGLNDAYVMDLLAGVLETFGGSLRSSYVLLKQGEQVEDDIWRRYNIRPITFDDYGPPLVARIEEIVRIRADAAASSAGGGHSGTARPAPTVPPAYTAWLRRQCGDIDLLGLRLKQGRVVTLNHVYVPLTTTATQRAEDAAHAEPPAGLAASREQPPLLLDLLDQGSLYLSGPPGSGKSTFCRWVAWLACGDALPAHEIPPPEGFAERFPASFRGRLPVLIRLRDFWTSLPDGPDGQELGVAEFEQVLESWVRQKQPGGLTWPLVRDHLDHGSALMIFDGVDEVPLVHGAAPSPYRPRAMLLSGLAAAVAAWTGGGNRLLVTSRPYGLAPGDQRRLGLRDAPVAELPADMQQLLVRRWFHCLVEHAADAAALAQEMFDHVSQRAEIAPLAVTPMLLTAMCIIYQEGKRLPQDKYDLYDRITDTVLCNRYPNDPAQVDLVRNRLCVVAYGMHTGHGLDEDRQTPQAETTHAEIDRVIQRYRDESPGTERAFQGAIQVREDLLTRSGLLLPRDGDRGGFYHFTFQDFLAAQRLLDLVPDEQLLEVFRRRAAHFEWRNTLSFVFSSLLAKSASPDRGIRLLSAIVDTLSPNSRESGSDAGLAGGVSPAISSLLDASRLAVVTADCLEILWGRGSGLRPEHELAFRDYCLAAIQRDIPIKERFELGLALGRLGDPRVVTDLRQRSAFVEIPAGQYRIGDNRKKDYSYWEPLDEETLEVPEPFLLSRYPVTNAQYRGFIEAGGYDVRDGWSDEGWRWKEEHQIHEPDLWRDTRWNGPTQPVVGISYWEAEAFTRWAGGRLPTEREWEAAARGPESLLYPWGDAWENGICNSAEAGFKRTSPVGIFPRSRAQAFGLDDMAGNVWEWCTDLFKQDAPYRVLRGGCWNSRADNCRAAVRNWDYPDNRNVDVVGCRLLVSSRQNLL